MSEGLRKAEIRHTPGGVYKWQVMMTYADGSIDMALADTRRGALRRARKKDRRRLAPEATAWEVVEL